MNSKYSEYRLREKVRRVEQLVSADDFSAQNTSTLKQIISYYRINHRAYRHFHSKDGFMHFRISQNGVFADDDVYYQPDVVSGHIKDGDKVLELGYGMGANILYLAHCHPGARFFGYDLMPLKSKNIPKNVRVYRQDFSDLSRFPSASLDLVYAIETIVHNEDKDRIFREIFRVLKPGGKLILFDYAVRSPLDTYDAEIRRAVELISKAGESAMIECVDDWTRHIADCGLKTVYCKDITVNALPDCRRLEQLACKIIDRPFRAKALFSLSPKQFWGNVIAGYLSFDVVNCGVLTYKEWLCTK